jgi:hypothetical protein
MYAEGGRTTITTTTTTFDVLLSATSNFNIDSLLEAQVLFSISSDYNNKAHPRKKYMLKNGQRD